MTPLPRYPEARDEGSTAVSAVGLRLYPLGHAFTGSRASVLELWIELLRGHLLRREASEAGEETAS